MLIPVSRSPHAQPVSFKDWIAKLRKRWEWVSKRWARFLVLASGVCFVIAFWSATTDKIVVGPFSVPKEYEERGYTSQALSNAVVQFIHGNQSTVSFTNPTAQEISGDSMDASADELEEREIISGSIDGKHVVSSFDQSHIPDVKVPLTSFSLESLSELLRQIIGRQPTQISGEIVALNDVDSSSGAGPHPQHTRVLIRYRIDYPEPSYSIFGYHWWSRRNTTITDTLNAYGTEDVVQKLALVTADALGRRALPNEDTDSKAARLIGRGNTYFGLNDYGRAERMYAFANGKKPSGHAFLCVGVIEEIEGNYANANTYYGNAAEAPHDTHDDDSAWASLYWGNLLLRHYHQRAAAISKYQAVLKLERNVHTLLVQAAAQNNLGFLYC